MQRASWLASLQDFPGRQKKSADVRGSGGELVWIKHFICWGMTTKQILSRSPGVLSPFPRIQMWGHFGHRSVDLVLWNHVLVMLFCSYETCSWDVAGFLVHIWCLCWIVANFKFPQDTRHAMHICGTELTTANARRGRPFVSKVFSNSNNFIVFQKLLIQPFESALCPNNSILPWMVMVGNQI